MQIEQQSEDSFLAIRNVATGEWLQPEGFVCGPLETARRFDSLEDARKERDRLPTWREVVRVAKQPVR